jgi:hypothetical protein
VAEVAVIESSAATVGIDLQEPGGFINCSGASCDYSINYSINSAVQEVVLNLEITCPEGGVFRVSERGDTMGFGGCTGNKDLYSLVGSFGNATFDISICNQGTV